MTLPDNREGETGLTRGSNLPETKQSSSSDAKKIDLKRTFLLFVLDLIEFVHMWAEVGRVATERNF